MTTNEHWEAVVLIIIGITITTPLALHLVGDPTRSRSRRRIGATLTAGAAGGIVSLTLPSGPLAASLAALWVIASAHRLTGYVLAWLRRPTLVLSVAIATCGWWLNAGLWLVAHRLGTEPLGFDRSITLLTVAHFHHAGVGLTALLGTAAVLRDHDRLPWLVGGAHQIGMVTVALGLTFDDRLALAGTIVLTVTLTGWAVTTVGLHRFATDRSTHGMLAVSAAAWCGPMLLALAWAVSPFRPRPLIGTFETMIRYHGAINAIGLVLCGLIALARLTRPRPTRPSQELTDDQPGTAHA